ncbi:Oxaloacetate decarboxylase gamma chain [hydrothermal vent metagenome]|uniref:Oxaloacetate decarboxylase gamma chain n=1 Tax=hydrothermal vent metagenome TaxID=652676 RepID=A0A1W1C0F6_9ZZZZ
MVVVFIFLAILVELMKLQAKLIEKYFPEKRAASPAKSATPTVDESARTAAIIAAITEFNKNKSTKA